MLPVLIWTQTPSFSEHKIPHKLPIVVDDRNKITFAELSLALVPNYVRCGFVRYFIVFNGISHTCIVLAVTSSMFLLSCISFPDITARSGILNLEDRLCPVNGYFCGVRLV